MEVCRLSVRVLESLLVEMAGFIQAVHYVDPA